jgi:hypothetical protein
LAGKRQTLGEGHTQVIRVTDDYKLHVKVQICALRESADYVVEVVANPSPAPNVRPPFIGSRADRGGPNAWMNEGSVWGYSKRSYQEGTQYPAVHEFGHLLGLQHPGEPGAEDEYSKDRSSLMGAGMEMRSAYYKLWQEKLQEEYSMLGPWRIVPTQKFHSR